MMITKMTRFNMKDFNKPNEPFVVSGRIIPSFENNVWTYTEEKFAEPYVKKYDDDDIDVSYIEEEDKVVFFITQRTTVSAGVSFVLIGMDTH
ncbi:uncharacterized protein S101413_02800 [Bacillus velezensis]|nr:uncharacterized protein S101413_02800 [Bacillus velezensis]